MIWFMFMLGFSFSLNVFLIAFLIFIFKDPNVSKKIYENFDSHVESNKVVNDPSRYY